MADEKLTAPWIVRALPNDAASVTRWFVVKSEMVIDGAVEPILCRILGWDDSSPPSWICELRKGNVCVHVVELNREEGLSLIQSFAKKPRIGRDSIGEPRRVEIPVSDWSRVLSVDTWSLRVPSVIYEMWATRTLYERIRQHWKSLSDVERKASGVPASGWLGSTIVFLPQQRFYFVEDAGGSSYLIFPDLLKPQRELLVIAEVLDGDICLSRSVAPLLIEPWRQLSPPEAMRYLRVRYVAPEFSAMNGLVLDGPPDAIALLPRDAHGWSGSDFRISVVGTQFCDTVKIGLMRGMGGGYFTQEPWRDRLPEIGFSPPVVAQYIAPSEESAKAAYGTLLEARAPLWICDPYADPSSLEPLSQILYGGRLLTRSKQIRPDVVTRAWAQSKGIEVRVLSKLHDRCLIGSQCGFLIGTSLNGLGDKHGFLVKLDASTCASVRDVFEELWSSAVLPTEPW
jgi:hypothetical protein